MMNPIYLTELDYERLASLVQAQRQVNGSGSTAQLGEELKRAKRVPSEEIPAGVVTMNSQVRLKEMRSGREMEITLVYPKDADVKAGKISVLAPTGTAILGSREGETVEWPVPAGNVTFQIMKVLYQPEAEGNFLL